VLANQPANALLAALPAEELALLQRHLEPVALKFREQLEAANRTIRHAYFLETGMASIIAVGRGPRKQSEVAMVGAEGMTGLAVVLGADHSPYEVVMQVGGHGQRIDAPKLRRVITDGGSIAKIFLRFAYVLCVQSGFAALANAQGTIEERLARWLLMANDRSDGDALLLTHDSLAVMLGVRRAGVTNALQAFARRGLISVSRGRIRIEDRDKLVAISNGLYGVPEAEFERLFGVRSRRPAPGT
jgi:CRP-like cAMP-binding protein